MNALDGNSPDSGIGDTERVCVFLGLLSILITSSIAATVLGIGSGN